MRRKCFSATRGRTWSSLGQIRSLSRLSLPAPNSLPPLKNQSFRFTSVSSKLDSFLAAGESYTPSQLALLPPDVRSDHQTIISVLRQAVPLDLERRKAFLEAQDLARQVQSPIDGRETSLDSLLSQLHLVARTPLFSSRPIAAIEPVLAQVDHLKTVDTGRLVTLVETLMDAARSLEDGVEVATWILRVTEEDQRVRVTGGQDIVYETIQELLYLPQRLHPRPNPEPLLRFLLSHQSQISLSFRPERHPLTALLEEYARLYTTERKQINPSPAPPSSTVVVRLENLRLQHLVAVREIHHAMREVGEELFTVRSCNSLMSAYNHGRAWEDMQEIWKIMRSEGGVGVDQRSVAIFFDACGFSGSLSLATSTFQTLLLTSFPLNPNNYHAYLECLTRCGAWKDELLPFLSRQKHSHLLDPTTTPPIYPGSLASTLMLANRLVKSPHQRSLREVDRRLYEELRRGMREVVGREAWEEVERWLGSRERFLEAGPKKESLMREQRKKTELHRL